MAHILISPHLIKEVKFKICASIGKPRVKAVKKLPVDYLYLLYSISGHR